MALSNSKSVIHRRLSTFVDFIATEDSVENIIRKQAEEIRGRIKGQAVEDALTVRSTPNSGSFEKRTGLRRHLRGDSVVEGQDVDLPFVVSPKTKDQEKIDSLLPRFERYAQHSYPNTTRTTTRSSVKLTFEGTKLSYDLVPMLATNNLEEQILIRSDGSERRTSLQKHTEFIKSRTRKSNEQTGRVKFNEMVRLFKWWRDFRQAKSKTLNEVPSIVIDLVSAAAFDARGVSTTYADTLADWFSWTAHILAERKAIAFSDYAKPHVPTDGASAWCVLDPVNDSNNVVASWAGWQVDEFTGWLTDGRDRMIRAVRHDLLNADADSLGELVELFGSPFKNNCGE